MCRNIKILFNFDPRVTESEIRNASLQFVRKISGFGKPSQANQAALRHSGRRNRPSLDAPAPLPENQRHAAQPRRRSGQSQTPQRHALRQLN
jgi:hypothetical protein